MANVLYWLRNDLRLHDNECWQVANALSDYLLPVFVLDPALYRQVSPGIQKTGPLRTTFLKETVLNLRSSLEKYSSNCLILFESPATAIPRLVEKWEISHLVYEKEVAWEEVEMERLIGEALSESGCVLHPVWGRTLYSIEDYPLPVEEMPVTSRHFKLKLKDVAVRPLIDFPTKLSPPVDIPDWGEWPEVAGLDGGEEPAYTGGENAALERLEFYTFGTENLTNYRWKRNQSLGDTFSSKFSPWMAVGALSPRRIYWTVKEYEERVKKNASTWWLIFELTWRDYFKFQVHRYGRSVFFSGGYRNKEVEWKTDHDLFQRWQTGTTGIPFIDAHMRQLNGTGYMSNRGRVNCASFLTRDYQIDWRWGAAWFENRLLDYDVESNWMNWSMQAFDTWYTNPVHQGLKYDKKGEFVRTYVNELADLDGPGIHAPWLFEDAFPDGYSKPLEVYDKWNRSLQKIRTLAGKNS